MDLTKVLLLFEDFVQSHSLRSVAPQRFSISTILSFLRTSERWFCEGFIARLAPLAIRFRGNNVLGEFEHLVQGALELASWQGELLSLALGIVAEVDLHPIVAGLLVFVQLKQDHRGVARHLPFPDLQGGKYIHHRRVVTSVDEELPATGFQGAVLLLLHLIEHFLEKRSALDLLHLGRVHVVDVALFGEELKLLREVCVRPFWQLQTPLLFGEQSQVEGLHVLRFLKAQPRVLFL